MALITLTVAKAHLQVDHGNDDMVITKQIGIAESIVFNYLKLAQGYGDGSPTLDESIQGAILLVLGALYRNRDGGNEATQNVPQPISQAVKDILHRYFDPALA